MSYIISILYRLFSPRIKNRENSRGLECLQAPNAVQAEEKVNNVLDISLSEMKSMSC